MCVNEYILRVLKVFKLKLDSSIYIYFFFSVTFFISLTITKCESGLTCLILNLSKELYV